MIRALGDSALSPRIIGFIVYILSIPVTVFSQLDIPCGLRAAA